MNDQDDSTDIQSRITIIRVLGIALLVFAGFFWMYHFVMALPFSGEGLYILVLTFYLPGGLGLLLYWLSGNMKRRDKFERLWASTSGELYGRAVFVNLKESKSGNVNGAVTVLMEDGSDIFILFNKESTGYIPELHDLVNITINRKRRAIKTELVEKASK
jgi:hypothetical protein